jgi:carboxypeptidase Taq
LAVLAGIAHERLCDPALADTLDAASAVAEPGSELEAQVREARRAVVKATAVPADLARAIAEHQSKAVASWQQARAANDFASFAPDLERMVALTIEQSDAYVAAGVAERRYDALLDGYEPGARESTLAPLLGALRDELAPLVLAVADSGRTIDESVCLGSFPRRCATSVRDRGRYGDGLRLRGGSPRRVGTPVHHGVQPERRTNHLALAGRRFPSRPYSA